jgi:hypothetical protein
MRIGALALLGLAMLAATEACGSSSEDAVASKHAGGAGGATSGGSAGAAVAGSAGVSGGLQLGGSGGMPVPDATVDGPVLLDAGWFDCGGCACDGATHYCLYTSGGFAPPPPPDASVCEEDGGSSHCKPLPGGCSPPSCACVTGPACSCTDDGGGLRVSCAYP